MKNPVSAVMILAISSIATFGFLVGCSKEGAGDKNVNVSAMTADLKSTDKDKRVDACVELAKAGPRAAPAVDSLIPLLKESDALVRRLAAYALGQIGPKASKALPAMKELLNDPDYNVQTTVVSSMRFIDAKSIDAKVDNVQTR